MSKTGLITLVVAGTVFIGLALVVATQVKQVRTNRRNQVCRPSAPSSSSIAEASRLWSAFTTTAAVAYGQEVILEVKSLGNLLLSSGEIVACDAFIPERRAFENAVPAGSYSVLISVAHFRGGDQRVAAAAVCFSAVQPARWTLATVPGQEATALREDEYFGYPVDSGTGCFMDREALEIWQKETADGADRLSKLMRDHYVHTWDWANLTLDAATWLNLIAFSSGMGDGSYPSYWGHGPDGDLVCLVTDFQVLDMLDLPDLPVGR